MSGQMKALLWKDARVHRPVLILGAVLVVLPYFGLLVGRLLASAEEASRPISDGLVGAALTGFLLSLVTLLGLGGGAFAAERESGASEFLGMLPVSRFMVLGSKVIFVTCVTAVVLLVNLTPLLALRADESATYTLGQISIAAPTATLVFCTAWLVSAGSRSATLASLGGLVAPMILGAGVRGLAVASNASLDPGAGYQTACLVLASLAFVAGCVVFLVRFEP